MPGDHDYTDTPSLRSQRARIGAYAQHAKHDVRATTKAGRDAFWARFLTEVDPDGLLPAAERDRRAAAARTQYMKRLSYLSAKARARGRKR